MSKKDTIYCTNCGKKENITNKRCSGCNHLLNDKDHEFKDYIFDKIKDKLKGDSVDKVSDLIKAFIKKYCYGIVLGASIIFTGVTAIVNNKQEYQITKESPAFKTEYGYKFLQGCWDSEDHLARYMFRPNREEFVIGIDGEISDNNKIYYNWLWMPYYDISKEDDKYSLDLYYKETADIKPVYSHSTSFKIIDDEHISMNIIKGYIQSDGSIKNEEKEVVLKRVSCSNIIKDVPSLEEYLREFGD